MISQQKKVIRERMRSFRNEMESRGKERYDQWIVEQLIQTVQHRKARVIHAYIPMRGEINILPFITYCLDAGLRVVCPKALPNRVLENRELHSLDRLEKGVMGTLHPAEQDLYDGHYDLIVVPGLAFDRRGYRVGYGGGYYDGFITGHPESFTVGIFYPFQELPEVPTEPHDQALKYLLIGEFDDV